MIIVLSVVCVSMHVEYYFILFYLVQHLLESDPIMQGFF